MRTTVNIPDALADAARDRADREGRTVTSLIVEGLRTVIERENPPAPSEPLPSFGTRGGRVLIDLDDRDAVWDALDADGIR